MLFANFEVFVALNLDKVFSDSYSEAERELVIFEQFNLNEYVHSDPQYSFRVKAYKEKREQKIAEVVHMLNALCNFRDRDLEHKRVKRAFKNILVPYTYLTECRSAVRDVELARKLDGQKTKHFLSLTPIKSAMMFRLVQKDGLASCLEFDLLASSLRFVNLGYFSVNPHLASWDYMLATRCRKIREALEPHFDAPSLKFFDEQAVIATTSIVHQLRAHTKPSGNKLLLNQEALAEDLLVRTSITWQAARSSYHNTDAYKEYSEMLKKARAALNEIKPYCDLDELTNHPKLQNDARTKLTKYYR